MKRVWRRLFDLAAAVSLALCVAMGVLWVRSYRIVDGWAWSDGVRVPTAGYNVAWRQMVISARGGMHYVAERHMGAAQSSGHRLPPDLAAFLLQMSRSSDTPDPADRSYGLAGFAYFSRHGYPLIASTRFGPPVLLSRGWVIPHWFLIAATALLPIVWFRAHLRRRRIVRGGLCPACGYDLRATPQRCPECGTLAATTTTT